MSQWDGDLGSLPSCIGKCKGLLSSHTCATISLYSHTELGLVEILITPKENLEKSRQL